MSSPVVQNPPVLAESKSAKKKKAKTERTESPAPAASPEQTVVSPDVCGADVSDDGLESPYIRELQKNIRNVNKKITNASKTDSIVEQHKDKSLEELVEAKLINADQRAQRLKKPQLESQLSMYEEQLAQYKKVDEDYRSRSAADKATLEKTLTEKFEKEKADAISELTEKAAADAKTSLHDNFLILSQFLRLAAARRLEEADAGRDENMALEGVLFGVYSGDEDAVSTMLKLIEGSSEVTVSVAGDALQTTYAQVKEAAMSYVGPFAATEAAPETTEATSEPQPATETEQSVAPVTLAENDTIEVVEPLTNGHAESTPQSSAPINADVADSAANAAAGNEWDTSNNASSTITQEGWVEVPRNPTETDNGLTATPAAASNVQSWADDQPEAHAAEQTAASGDGFHQVQRNRPRGHDREGGWRGRGRGDHRGGHRGGFHEGRGGRGRGRGRGGNMAMRGRSRPEES